MEDDRPRRGGDSVPCTSDIAIIGHSLDSRPAVSLPLDPTSGLRLAAPTRMVAFATTTTPTSTSAPAPTARHNCATPTNLNTLLERSSPGASPTFIASRRLARLNAFAKKTFNATPRPLSPTLRQTSPPAASQPPWQPTDEQPPSPICSPVSTTGEPSPKTQGTEQVGAGQDGSRDKIPKNSWVPPSTEESGHEATSRPRTTCSPAQPAQGEPPPPQTGPAGHAPPVPEPAISPSLPRQPTPHDTTGPSPTPAEPGNAATSGVQEPCSGPQLAQGEPMASSPRPAAGSTSSFEKSISRPCQLTSPDTVNSKSNSGAPCLTAASSPQESNTAPQHVPGEQNTSRSSSADGGTLLRHALLRARLSKPSPELRSPLNHD